MEGAEQTLLQVPQRMLGMLDQAALVQIKPLYRRHQPRLGLEIWRPGKRWIFQPWREQALGAELLNGMYRRLLLTGLR